MTQTIINIIPEDSSYDDYQEALAYAPGDDRRGGYEAFQAACAELEAKGIILIDGNKLPPKGAKVVAHITCMWCGGSHVVGYTVDDRAASTDEVNANGIDCAPVPTTSSEPRPSTILKATSYFGGSCLVEITETGWRVLIDDRNTKDGWLHICDLSAPAITEACRDQLLKYMYIPCTSVPGVGASPQRQYLAGMSLAERERIGNDGKRAYYA